MERSTIHLLAKRGKSQRPDRPRTRLQPHHRVSASWASRSDRRRPAPARPRTPIPSRPDPALARTRASAVSACWNWPGRIRTSPYTGGRSVFTDAVRRIRREQDRPAADVPLRFEGLPGEYLQVDWGEIRHFPFTAQPPATRYFLACRLKYSRWVWVRFTSDMRQETLFRGLAACLVALAFVPWVLVFDNMKTVTSGRDEADQPLWTAALRQFAAECGFHPEACAPAAGNQKGAVESLVKWVKGNFLAGSRLSRRRRPRRAMQALAGAGQPRPSAATVSRRWRAWP